MNFLILFSFVIIFMPLDHAVKIGISRPLTTTLPPNITANTDLAEISTTIDEDEDTTTLASISFTSTTLPTTEKTRFPLFAVPTFPPKGTKKPKTKVSSTTAAPDTEVVTTGTTKKSPTEQNQPTKPNLFGANHFCQCDFLRRACDVNCCCDLDCSPEALKVFNCEEQKAMDRANLETFQYDHGLPLCRVNDGWLCVFRTNIRPESHEQHLPSLDTSQYDKWPNLVYRSTDSMAQSALNYYRYKEALKLINLETLEVMDFTLPYAYWPPYCQLKEPVKHLTDSKSACLYLTPEEVQDITRNILETLNTFRLLKQPNPIPESEMSAKDFVDISYRKCSSHQQCECADISLTKNNLTTLLQEWADTYETDIDIKLLHNYTHILKAQIQIKTRDSYNQTEGLQEYWLHLSVAFVYRNLSSSSKPAEEPYKKVSSGALGYRLNEPVIIAVFMANNLSEELTAQNRLLSYFHPNATTDRRNHTLDLFTKDINELCYKTRTLEHLVNYGINIHKQCKVRLNKFAIKSETNFTAICLELQQLSLQQMLPTNFTIPEMSHIYISQLGKPQNNTAKWLPLEVKNLEFSPIVGEYHEESRALVCRNMLLSLSYEFYAGNTFEQDISDQAVIKYAALVLGERHDVEFTLPEEDIELPLTIAVMFYDFNENVHSGGAYLKVELVNLKTVTLVKLITFITTYPFVAKISA